MRLIDADALTLCTYDYHWCCGSFKAVPEETLNDAPTLVVGPDGDIVPESVLAKWYKPDEKLPEKSGSYICLLKDRDGTVYQCAGILYLKDHAETKDGWYEEYSPEYGYFALYEDVLYWLKLPEWPEGVVLS